MKLHLSLAFVAALLGSGCADPVHDDSVAALGPEADGVQPGPDHRPGQPCLVCHGGDGPGELVMRFGGTVYQQPTRDVPLAAGFVNLRDADGTRFKTETNCVGNFYVEAGQFDPVFPVHVTVDYGATSTAMKSHIGRDGSCASCHQGENASSDYHVYLSASPISLPPSGCP